MAHRRHPPRREIPLEQFQIERLQAEIQQVAKQRSNSCFGCVITLFSMLVLWGADLFLLTLYWNWFAVPLGAPTATVWHTAGILVLRLAYGSCLKGFTDAWKHYTKPPDEASDTPRVCTLPKSDLAQVRFTLIIAVVLRLIGFVAALIIHTRIAG